MAIPLTDITAVILAGGRGRRMGGQDKGLIGFNGQPLIRHLLDAIKPQVESVLINANRNRERYAAFGQPVVCDDMEGYQGPLAGFAAAMASAETPYLVTLPCDGPLLPTDYVRSMAGALEAAGAEIAVAHSGARLQPVYALLPTSLRPSLIRFLARGDRKIDLWYAGHRMTAVDFSHCPDAFRNINTPGDRDKLERPGARA